MTQHARKQKITLVLAILGLCLLVLQFMFPRCKVAAEQGSGTAEQEVKALSDQLVQAYLKADTSFIEKYYADDAIVIHSDGKLITKAQEIEALKSGRRKYESIDVRERKIKVYGNMGMNVSLSSVKMTFDGKPLSADFRSTRTWLKQDGNWKLVAFQSTHVAASQ